VIRNLVSNALKFTPEKGTVRVHVTWHWPIENDINGVGSKKFRLGKGEEVSLNSSGYVKVKVDDTGAGMSKPQLENLFQAGVQFNANELQQGQGSGFGLFIAKGIVELHQGTLCADSTGLGGGTSFAITLPLYHSPDVDRMQASESSVSMSRRFLEFSALSILVVDDALSNRKLLSRLLKNAGHSIDQAENGDVALRMVKDKMAKGDRYDTVLLDYEMPVMNGPTAAEEMRRAGSDVFIVGITGNMLPEDVSFFISCGANAVLPKPFKLSDLEDLWVEAL
jgi:CheY-like chemotaxis protein